MWHVARLGNTAFATAYRTAFCTNDSSMNDLRGQASFFASMSKFSRAPPSLVGENALLDAILLRRAGTSLDA